MVRIKFRYIAVKFVTEKNIILSQESYKKIIYDATYEEYGKKIISRFYSYKMIEYLPNSNVLLFRIQRDIHKETILSIQKLQKIGNLNVKASVMCVSGSVRNLMKKTKEKLEKNL
ncbi:hypothetical protein BDAP_000685 [Binucleata daphniae]